MWLDLGCGTGVLTAELRDLGASVIGADGSPAMLAQARAEMMAREGPSVDWLQCDVQSVPLEDRAVDGVLCSSVLEYVDQPTLVLKEIARLVRPGGMLVFSVPIRQSAVRTTHKWARWLSKWVGRDACKYLSVSKFEVDPRSVADWCGEAGFTVERATGFDPWLPPATFAILKPALLIVEARRRGA